MIATASASVLRAIAATGSADWSDNLIPLAAARACTSRTIRANTSAESGSTRYFQVTARVVTDSAINPAQAANFDHSRLSISATALVRTVDRSMAFVMR